MDDNDDEENPFHTEPCGTEDDNALGWAGFGVELTKKRKAQDNKVDEWEAFHTKTWGAEDEDDTNWARLEGRPVKKGEECNVKEDTEKEDTPYSKSQLAPCNMLHMAQWVTLGGTRSLYDLQGCLVHSGWLVLALRVARPPWDCLDLPMGSMLGVALGMSPLRSIPVGGCSMGQG